MNSNTFQDNPSTTGDGAISLQVRLARPLRSPTCASARSSTTVPSSSSACSSARPRSRCGSPTARTIPGRPTSGASSNAWPTALRELHDALPHGWELFIEHKPYEPAFYSSVNADWGTSLLLAQHAGERARCLVDLGHHLPNTNIEQVVSRLAMVGRLGGFHFNDSKYGDDDLTVGSIHPYQFFLIVLRARRARRRCDARRALHDRRVAQPQGPDRGPHPGHRPDPVSRSPRRCSSTATRSRTRRTPTIPRSPPRCCTTRTAPTSARSSPRRAAATVPRSRPLVTFRRARLPRRGRSPSAATTPSPPGL